MTPAAPAAARYRLARALDGLTHVIEHAEILDRAAEVLGGWISRIVPAGPIRDMASGTPTAHPLHPPLAALTSGSFTAGTILQLTGRDDRAARRMVGTGLLAALPTAYTGSSDWSYTAGAERRVGLVHAAVNDVGVTCYLVGWLGQRSGRRGLGIGLWLAGWSLLALGGMLGGHLGYGLGVGADTTAFEHLGFDWLDVAAESDIPRTGAVGAHVSGVPVLLARHNGSIVALADRCTHRGAPLHEGTIDSGCVECPWHGSRFSLADGGVVAGPAVRPQPVLLTRVANGRVQVKRDEQRSLRTRPVW